MASADLRLLNAANDLLANIPTELEARGIVVPPRRYIHAGLIAQDFVGAKCADAFVVSWLSITQGQVGAGAGGGIPQAAIRCAMPLSHQFTIALLRCVPVQDEQGRAPSEAKLNASATEILTDAMTLAAVIVDLVLADTLFSSRFTLTGIGNLSAVGPNGGLGGSVLSLFVTLV